MSLLLGYGAGVVNPYVAFETIDDMIEHGLLTGIDRDKAIQHYIKALNKGVLKVMSKMGISALQSYCGAQVFEAIGLNQEFIDKYFTHTTSRVSGVGIDVIAEEVRLRHARAFGRQPVRPHELESGGEYQWRRDGEYHLFNPDTVFKLQHATRSGQYSDFQGIHAGRRSAERASRHAARPVPLQAGRRSGADRRGGAGVHDRQAVRHRCDVLRLDQRRGARDAGHRDEPPWRQVEHRRGRRGSGALSSVCRTATRSAARSSRSRPADSA